MSDIIHGRNLIVSVGGEALAAAKSCELDIKADTIEVSDSAQGSFKTFIGGRKSWSVSCGCLVLAVGVNVSMLGSTVTLTFGVDNDTVSGDAIVTGWKCSGAWGNLANGSFSFQGSGELSVDESEE